VVEGGDPWFALPPPAFMCKALLVMLIVAQLVMVANLGQLWNIRT
jgi:hypothetical protein